MNTPPCWVSALTAALGTPNPLNPRPPQESEYHTSKLESDVYPDFVMMAKSCGVPGRRVVRPADLRAAVRCAAPHNLHALVCPQLLRICHHLCARLHTARLLLLACLPAAGMSAAGRLQHSCVPPSFAGGCHSASPSCLPRCRPCTCRWGPILGSRSAELAHP